VERRTIVESVDEMLAHDGYCSHTRYFFVQGLADWRPANNYTLCFQKGHRQEASLRQMFSSLKDGVYMAFSRVLDLRLFYILLTFLRRA
jgi:hypothetical protein